MDSRDDIPEEGQTKITVKPVVHTDGRTHTLWSFEDSKTKDMYDDSVPTKKERRENLDNVTVSCHNCEKTLRHADIKVCSRCKNARYCSPECQKSHWRKHKAGCGPGHCTILKLAERSLAVPALMEYLIFAVILHLDLAAAPENARTHFIHQLLSGGPKDDNPELMVAYSKIEKISREDAPERTRKCDTAFRQSYKGALPVTTIWFTAEDGGGLQGEVSKTMEIPVDMLTYVKEKRTVKFRSAMLGDSEYPLNAETLRESINNHIRMDKLNQMRLRVKKNSIK
ncbi:hypothetical protein IW261DRAFT_1606769 [Armillaria novae-zelandiae]|uniref:MYND-type domain-containing protein n=1 Tax=Armillaria novae-zelandiae TaxID=153914 RepID=A0AA39UJK0_9AGAR|nr:hypothetical protein IW261DRAFT_1606769 [Armillaria novae-zelandiae]